MAAGFYLQVLVAVANAAVNETTYKATFATYESCAAEEPRSGGMRIF